MSVGVPYAWACHGCYRAVICPVCGEHIVGSMAYAQHFQTTHIKDGVEDPSRPFSGEDAIPKMCGDDGIRTQCHFCRQLWGKCTCKWNGSSFEHGGDIITEPNLSECGRFFVNPEVYYGDAYKRWAASR